MIIPRHKVCDICEKPVGVNKRYYKIKSKNYIVCSAGSCSDNRVHHICEDCMHEFAIYLQSKYQDKNIGCHICPASDHCYDAFMNHAVHCGNYATWDKTER